MFTLPFFVFVKILYLVLILSYFVLFVLFYPRLYLFYLSSDASVRCWTFVGDVHSEMFIFNIAGR